MFAKMKTIFGDRDTLFYRNFDQQPLKIKIDYSTLVVSIYMG